VVKVSLAAQLDLRRRMRSIAERAEQPAEAPDDDHGVAGAVRYISTDDTSKTRLYNRAMQDALEGLLGNERLDVIGFDACLMAMVETAYAMRSSGLVMVGSQELEPGTGWRYDFWLAELVKVPGMTGSELGSVLVDEYERTYKTGAPTTTLSALDLKRVNALAGRISELADALITTLDSDLDAIQAARAECHAYAPAYGLHGIDLGRFCEQIGSKSSNPEVRERAGLVRTELAGLVLRNYAGADRQGKFGSTGAAIYFPESRNAYIFDIDGHGYDESNTEFPVAFVRDHRWDNFLHAYFDKVAYGP
jgi:hypothetical protein